MKGGGELGPRMNHFYVPMAMDASLMRTMNIPKKFAKINEGSLSENVKIEGPSGITWHVKMIRSNGTFALRSGWKEFVAANKIDKHDALVFTYNGNSSFKVIIFDPSGCEKAAPFFAKKEEIDSGKSTDSFMQVGAVPLHEVKKEIISITSYSDTDSSEISSHTARALKRKRRDILQDSTQIDKGGHRIVRKRKEHCHKKTSRLYIVPHKTNLTKAQQKIANRLTRNTQKGSELFVKILAPSHTSVRCCKLNLPSGFACKVLQDKEMKITLLPADSDETSNGCTANYYKNRSTRSICKGWDKFVRRNALKEGDLCLFELRKQEKQGRSIFTMVVHFGHK